MGIFPSCVNAGKIPWLSFSLYLYMGLQGFADYNIQRRTRFWEIQLRPRLFFTADMDKYETPDQYCLPPNYKPETDVFFMYVEVTLLGCKYLCQNLHDLQCTLIVYMPFKRSCVLQPDVKVHGVQCDENSIKVEIHRRRRTTGTHRKHHYEWQSAKKVMESTCDRLASKARQRGAFESLWCLTE